MATATKIAAPAGFNTITVFHDSKASRKGDRCWKVVVPLGPSMTERVRITHLTHDGIDTSNGSSFFAEALEAATQIIEDRFGVTPEWETHPAEDGFGGFAKWRFA